MIEPLGFSLSDKYLKRAGLDYWNLMTYHTYPDFGEFLRQHPDARMHFASTKAPRGYHEATYQDGDFLIFGCETRGLPENLLEQVYDRCIRIPMRPEARSLKNPRRGWITFDDTVFGFTCAVNSHQEIAAHPIIERGIWMFLSR